MNAAPAAAAPSSGATRSRGGRWIPVALMVLPFLLLGLALLTRQLKERWSAPPALPVIGEVAPFKLEERGGYPVSREDLQGRIWIAAFVFTRCSGPCPAMCGSMADLQKTIRRKVQDIRLVTFTLDPEYDTAEVLGKYAQRFGADANKWLWVRGDRAAIQQLAQQGFKLNAVEGQGGDIVHSTHLVLVDHRSRIRGYYNGTDVDSVNKLRADMDLLIKEAKR